MRRKKLIIILVIVLMVTSLLGLVGWRKYNSSKTKCFDIIGDGYAMGTDPEPVVIGNTCDK